jgi:hypothetical protein
MDLEAHWWWLAAGVLLPILEIVVPGVFLIWLAFAAILTALVVLVFGLAVPFQVAAFTLFSIAAVLGGRRWYERHPVTSSDPMLNERTRRLVGETVTVVAAIEYGEGRVRVGDGVWPARGPDAPAGARVRVTGADGTCLRVQPLQLLPDANEAAQPE